MTPKQKRAEALARMTKAELVKTVVALDARQTKLLNELQHTKDLYDAQLAKAGRLADGFSRAVRRIAQWRGKYERVNAALGAKLADVRAGLNNEQLCPIGEVTSEPEIGSKPFTEADAPPEFPWEV